MNVHIVNRITVIAKYDGDAAVLQRFPRSQALLQKNAQAVFDKLHVHANERECLLGGCRFAVNDPIRPSSLLACLPDHSAANPDGEGYGKIIDMETGDTVYQGRFKHVSSFDDEGNQLFFEGRSRLSALERAGLSVVLAKAGIIEQVAFS